MSEQKFYWGDFITQKFVRWALTAPDRTVQDEVNKYFPASQNTIYGYWEMQVCIQPSLIFPLHSDTEEWDGSYSSVVLVKVTFAMSRVSTWKLLELSDVSGAVTKVSFGANPTQKIVEDALRILLNAADNSDKEKPNVITCPLSMERA